MDKKIKILTTTNTNLTANQTTMSAQPGTTFQLCNQFFTITPTGKNITSNQLVNKFILIFLLIK